MNERIEIRDGREFRVTVLPEAKPKKQSSRKVGGGKAYSRSAKMADNHATAPTLSQVWSLSTRRLIPEEKGRSERGSVWGLPCVPPRV